MPTLNVEIAGLCGVVFEQDVKKTAANAITSATLLMQDLMRAETLSDGTTLDPHYPRLDVSEACVVATANERPKNALKPGTAGSPATAMYLLVWDDVEILPDGNAIPAPLSVSNGAPADQYKPTTTEAASLWWLVTAEDARPKEGKTKRFFVDQPPNGGRILTRVRLQGGTLGSLELTPHKCQFLDAQLKFDQRIAVSLLWQVPFTDRVKIALTNAGVTQHLELVPAKAGEDISIKLRNIEISDLIGIPGTYTVNRPLLDFEVYTKLLASYVKDKTPPLPAPDLEQFLAVREGPCSPAGFYL